MSVALIVVPYYLGRREIGMGRGPTHLVESGAQSALGAAGFDVSVSVVEFGGPLDHEVGATFAVNSLLSEHVRAALGNDQFPLVLAGNCNSCLGTLAGLGADDLGVVWFDAHGDFHTPDTTPSGFLDGMGLNVAIGGSWTGLARALPGFQPVAANKVVLAGIRALDPGEDQLLRRWGVELAPFRELRTKGVAASLTPRLDAVAAHTNEVYVHVDLDVLDRDSVPANEYSPGGGLFPDELFEALELLGQRFTVRAAALASYNPDADPNDKAMRVAVDVIKQLATLGETVPQEGTA